MEKILEFMRIDNFLLIVLILIIILIITCVISWIQFNKLSKRYKNFIKKMSNGSNFEETLNIFMNRVNTVAQENEEIIEYCKKLDNNISKCIKKVGIVRYNAFKDTGSDLSFALALLNNDNTGVVLNGIYSRDMSNIYAKPINKGKSPYALSEEEIEAISKATNEKEL